MEKNSILLFIGLLIVVLNLTIGRNSLPIWAWLTIIVFSVSLLVYCITKTLYDISAMIEKNIQGIKDNTEKISDETKSQLNEQYKELITQIASNKEALQKQIDRSGTCIVEATTKVSEELVSKLDSQQNLLIDMSQKKSEAIEALANSAKLSVSQIISKISSVTDSLGILLKQMQKSITDENDTTRSLISETISKMATDVSSRIEDLLNTYDQFKDVLLQKNEEQYRSLHQKIEGFSRQAMELQNSVASSMADLSVKSDAVSEALGRTKDDIKQHLQLSEEKLSENIECSKSETLQMLSETVDSVKNTSNSAMELLMQSSKEHYDDINKAISAVHIKAQSIEDKVSILSKNNNSEFVIKSMTSVIYELKKDLGNSVSGISNQILDSQASAKDELSKLQLILQSIQEDLSFVDPESTITVDTITDEVTGNIVQNQFEKGCLTKSIMKDSQGHILYELEYVGGQISKSKNYDVDGHLNIEQAFYSNGQVHYRNEYTKVTTEFDINGKKK